MTQTKLNEEVEENMRQLEREVNGRATQPKEEELASKLTYDLLVFGLPHQYVDNILASIAKLLSTERQKHEEEMEKEWRRGRDAGISEAVSALSDSRHNQEKQ